MWDVGFCLHVCHACGLIGRLLKIGEALVLVRIYLA